MLLTIALFDDAIFIHWHAVIAMYNQTFLDMRQLCQLPEVVFESYVVLLYLNIERTIVVTWFIFRETLCCTTAVLAWRFQYDTVYIHRIGRHEM